MLAARDAGTQRAVFASSSSVYGRAQELPKTERLVPQPISPYGVSKLAAEQYCMGLNAAHGIEVAALRSFNVFGPRQDPSSQYSGVIPKFLSQALEACPVICGDDTQLDGGEIGDPGGRAALPGGMETQIPAAVEVVHGHDLGAAHEARPIARQDTPRRAL